MLHDYQKLLSLQTFLYTCKMMYALFFCYPPSVMKWWVFPCEIACGMTTLFQLTHMIKPTYRPFLTLLSQYLLLYHHVNKSYYYDFSVYLLLQQYILCLMLIIIHQNYVIVLPQGGEEEDRLKTCYICLDTINTSSTISIRYQYCDCQNQYHVSCLSKWISVSSKCPICRKIMI